MTIQIYNTLSGKKEIFKPVDPNHVRMYVCGPTVYDSSHIGHARSVVVFDVIARYLKEKGFDVIYVRNFTDVDDKIINRAKELGLTPQQISEKYINEFHQDMNALNVKRPTMEPKATEHIKEIIELVEILIKKGSAYQVDNDVYFSVESFKEYGKLSGRKLEDMKAGARIEIDTRKQNPFDFALWKSSKPEEPFWESPWGKGRPGWHIECSAMSMKYLGETFDIHGGGKDLIFPHHENEIAQSEAASGKPFVKYWIHNGFVNVNKEKMSKSLGNFLMIKDVNKKYHPDVTRLFLLSKHYRSPIDFTDKALDEASSSLDKIYSLLERIEKRMKIENYAGEYKGKNDLWEKFSKAMDDDFNSARGIGILFETVRETNRLLDNKEIAGDIIEKIKSAQKHIIKTGSVLGIITQSTESYFSAKKASIIKKESVDPAFIDGMIQDRAEARKAKDWELADNIRKKLSKMNIVIKDTPDGTIWKVQK